MNHLRGLDLPPNLLAAGAGRNMVSDAGNGHRAAILGGADDIGIYECQYVQKSGGNANAIPLSRRTQRSYSLSMLSRHCFLAWLLQWSQGYCVLHCVCCQQPSVPILVYGLLTLVFLIRHRKHAPLSRTSATFSLSCSGPARLPLPGFCVRIVGDLIDDDTW